MPRCRICYDGFTIEIDSTAKRKLHRVKTEDMHVEADHYGLLKQSRERERERYSEMGVGEGKKSHSSLD